MDHKNSTVSQLLHSHCPMSRGESRVWERACWLFKHAHKSLTYTKCSRSCFLIFILFLPLQGERPSLPTSRRTCFLSSENRRTKIYWWGLQSKAARESCSVNDSQYLSTVNSTNRPSESVYIVLKITLYKMKYSNLLNECSG